jgi:hypothetical protein
LFAWFFGGLAMFHDAPIQPCSERVDYLYSYHPDGYCGKQGQDHTASDFRRFQKWQEILFLIWPPGILALVLLQRGQSKK